MAQPSPKLWQWLRRYRIWEANRKDVLYPENWLEPERREDDAKRDEAVRRRPDDKS
jgi:ABC toxin N-terminal region